jgi:hypothetical protein
MKTFSGALFIKYRCGMKVNAPALAAMAEAPSLMVILLRKGFHNSIIKKQEPSWPIPTTPPPHRP